jgi:hypothetical protein
MTSGANNKMIVAGNPLRSEGRMYEIFNKPAIAKNWFKIYVSALGESWLEHVRLSDTGKKYVSKYADSANALQLIETYGLKSPIVQARVFANFPTAHLVDTTFSFDAVMAAMMREVAVSPQDEVQIGVDCARFGDDETVFFIRRGNRCRFEVMAMSSAADIIGRIAQLCEEEPDLTRPHWNHRPMVVVDEGAGGGGGSVCDLLWAQGYTNVHAVEFGNPSRWPERFANVAAEMWLYWLPQALPNLQLPQDDPTLNQLITRKYEFTGIGLQRRVERKIAMKARGLASPDRAEALCLAVYPPPRPSVI